ncbi:MAG: YebC/PmpR family DNA-binding transcriptional regulator [Clostridia bacterium]|nr:YebC/PmpR family DNA-binding transcriptional regulator [Clostridia bacterium]
MSGHSKWKNIMHKKGKTDAQRAKIFTKVSKEIIMAVKEGGADPSANTKLRDCIAKAKANNVPNDNIERVIKKASGADNTATYEENVYEGYGPGGVAVLVETLTDNKNRTASSIRHYFDKFGGNMGTSGSVSWMFEEKGVIIISKEDENGNEIDADTLMMVAPDNGAEDFSEEDEDTFEIITAPENFTEVCDNLSKEGYNFASAQKEKVPSNYVSLTDEEQIKFMDLLLEHLDDDDDVQDVWTNLE